MPDSGQSEGSSPDGDPDKSPVARWRFTRKQFAFAGLATVLSVLLTAVFGIPIAEIVTRQIVRAEYREKVNSFNSSDAKVRLGHSGLGFRADPDHPIEYRMHPSHAQSRLNVAGQWITATNTPPYLGDAWNLVSRKSGLPYGYLRWIYDRKTRNWVACHSLTTSGLTNLTNVAPKDLTPELRKTVVGTNHLHTITKNDRQWIHVSGTPGTLVSNQVRYFRPQANSYPKPGWTWRYTVTEQGFRDRSNPLQADTSRVLFRGDSELWGWGIDDHATLCEQIEEQLVRDDPAPPSIQCINLGVPGYNTEQELIVLREQIDRIKPDAVVLWHVRNDLEPQLVAPARPEREFRHVFLNSWFLERSKTSWNYGTRRAYSITANLVANLGIQLDFSVDWLRLRPNRYLGNPDSGLDWNKAGVKQAAARAALAAMRDECRRRNCPLLVVSSASLAGPDFIPKFYRAADVVKGWATELETPYLNLMPWVAKLDHNRLRVSRQDGHSNAEANAIYAGVMVKVLRGLLEDGWGFRPAPHPD